MVDEAAKNELSNEGVQEVKNAINEHEKIFKIRLERGGPAIVLYQALWKAAPHQVSKHSRSGFRTMIVPKPANAPTKVKQ